MDMIHKTKNSAEATKEPAARDVKYLTVEDVKQLQAEVLELRQYKAEQEKAKRKAKECNPDDFTDGKGNKIEDYIVYKNAVIGHLINLADTIGPLLDIEAEKNGDIDNPVYDRLTAKYNAVCDSADILFNTDRSLIPDLKDETSIVDNINFNKMYYI